MRPLSLLSSLAISALVSSLPALAHDHAVVRGRLVFADHEKPVVRVLDLDTGEVMHSFDLPKANPGFATAQGGRFVVIKTGDDAGTIRFLDTGLTIESHGDYNDIQKGPVKLLDLAIAKKGDVAELWVRRGLCKHELGDEAGASSDFQGAIGVDPKFAAAHYYLGVSLAAQKKKAEAKASLKKASELGKGTPIGKQADDKLKAL